MSSSNFNPYSPPETEVGNFIISDPQWPPWPMIFVRPRATIRRIIDSRQTKAFLPLAMTVGIIAALPRGYRGFLVDGSWSKLLFGQILPGALGGVFGLYFFGYVIWRIGRWLGGQATQRDVRIAMAWSTIPLIPCVILHLIVLVMAGYSLETMRSEELKSRTEAIFLLLLVFSQLIAFCWASFVWVNVSRRLNASHGSRRSPQRFLLT